jgi:hypothetical protein
MLMERDYLNKTVLKVITNNRFYPLLMSDKVIRTIDLLWIGEITRDCDAKLADISSLMSLSQSTKLDFLQPFKALNEKSSSQFWFNHTVLKNSVRFIFARELILAAA